MKLLEGKKGIIFGALDENSLAWKTAEKVCEQGASILLTNAPIAMRMGKINELAKKCNTEVIPADATKIEDLTALFEKAKETFGGVDFVLHSIGMSPNVRKKRSYTDLNYDFLKQTLDVSAISFHKTLQTAFKTDAINKNGSVVTLSYIAAQRVLPDYSDMADAKSLLESIVRSFGYHYGKHKGVRINSVSQSPTKTTAGNGISGFNSFFDFAEDIAPLGNASAESCADYIAVLFSEYTRMVTMQNLFHDGGFSSTQISETILEKLNS